MFNLAIDSCSGTPRSRVPVCYLGINNDAALTIASRWTSETLGGADMLCPTFYV
jgi:hypothetical protein